MKPRLFGAVLGLCVAGLAVVPRAGGQTKADYLAGRRYGTAQAPVKSGGDNCTAPPRVVRPMPFHDSGDTTGAANHVNDIPVACNGRFPLVGGPDQVYEFEVVMDNSLTFTVSTSSATYDPSIYVLSTCDDGATCISGAAADDCFSADLPQPGSCPSGTSAESFGPITLPDGVYYFYIDSFYSSVAQPSRAQGAYDLAVSGTLPVELLRFEVE